MNPIDIHRLQVLNDLVAQTIDIINQRNLAAVGFGQQSFVGGGYYGGGLSHTPFTPYAQHTPYAQQWGAQQIMPQYPTMPWGVPSPLAGLSHTPYVDPRWAFATQSPFASQSPFATQSPFQMMPFVR